jgi:phosphoserine phosphatase RsbU/P
LETPLSGSEVLRIFRSDEARLFVAVASITVGLIAIGFSLIRRRFDRLLSFFAWFAAQYGSRLWMQSGVFNLMDGPSVAIDRLKMALNFFASISAFLFFEAGGFAGRAGRLIVYAVCLSELCLIAAIFLGVPLPLLDQSNSVLVIVSSASLVFLAFRQPAIMTDAIVFRAGMVAFVGLVLWTNVVVLLGHRATYEFYGFAVLMCSLGYVAARRALDRDQQLGSIQQELEIARRIQLSILPTASLRRSTSPLPQDTSP